MSFGKNTQQSKTLATRARAVFPSGISSNNYLIAALGYPLFIDHAEGANLYDVDGNQYLDFWPSHSALLVGHNHPVMVKAIQDQLALGSNFGLASEVQVELAERLQERFPSLERLVFTDSNSKATGYSVKLARAATGRPVIAKIQGGYHGSADSLWYGLQMPYGEGPGDRPVPVQPGISPNSPDEIALLQWNDIAASQAVLERVGDRLAGVILEPVLGDGDIPPEPGYLEFLREHCDSIGAVLIFDEALTCGMSFGGAQQFYGVIPDVTIVGKPMGGGLPLAAIGGSEQVMALTDPLQGKPRVPISMTYPGHPVACAAGIAQLDLLGTDEYEYMRGLTDILAEGTRDIAESLGVPLSVTTVQHLFYFHWGPDRIQTWRDHYFCNQEVLARIQGGLLEQGIYLGSQGRACVSTAHSEGDMSRLIEGVSSAIRNARTT